MRQELNVVNEGGTPQRRTICPQMESVWPTTRWFTHALTGWTFTLSFHPLSASYRLAADCLLVIRFMSRL